MRILEYLFCPDCPHKWKTIEKVMMPSAFEQLKQAGLSKLKGGTEGNFFVKKSIIILQCTECGKLDKTITEN